MMVTHGYKERLTMKQSETVWPIESTFFLRATASHTPCTYPAPCTNQQQKRCFTTEGTAGRPVSPMEELPEVYTVVANLQHDRLVAVHTSIESVNKITASTDSGKEIATGWWMAHERILAWRTEEIGEWERANQARVTSCYCSCVRMLHIQRRTQPLATHRGKVKPGTIDPGADPGRGLRGLQPPVS